MSAGSDSPVVESEAPAGTLRVFGIRHGRALSFAPAWPCSEARVLFDARSGDHWVLSGGSAALVLQVMASGPVTAGAACSDELALLIELEEGGILQSRVL